MEGKPMAFVLQDLFGTEPAPIGPESVRWEETACLLCGNRRWQTLVEAQDKQAGTELWFAVVQCLECGLCFTNPRPTTTCLDHFYPSDYRPHQTKEEKPTLHRQLLKRWRRPQAPLPWQGEGRLLDFGCGGGTFLQEMRDHGWQVMGVDTSAETVRRLRNDLGLHVLQGTLPHAELDAASFDVITMWHSLEHVPDPRAVLTEARRLIAPAGKLIVAVPNIDSLAFRTFGPHWFALDVPRHLVHFAPFTLHFMLEQAGFRVEKIKMLRRSSWLRHSARLACKHPESNLWHRLYQGRVLSRLAAFYSCLTNQSDCMVATATPLAA
jgi:2-polyprenyl-3-methyl-5-hydroxy-6-metoxy-1,4-benzoquinol methylase